MAKKTIIFLGSKPIGYNCLETLIGRRESLGVEISGILTQSRKEFGNGHDLRQLAADHNIPIFASLTDLSQCDIIYSVQYHEILKQEDIAKAKQVAVNLHMAPLPEYRGSNQFSFALIEGKTEFGTTIHKMEPGVDNGDILFQKRFPIPAGCWVDELYELTYNASLELFEQTLSHIISGNYTPVAQELLSNKYGTSLHYRKEMDALKIIDLGWEQEKIERYIRATSMPGFEPPYCLIAGKKVYFTTK